MAGVAFPQEYPQYFHRYVLASTRRFKRQLLHFTRLTWAHDGTGKRHLLIKNSAHTVRVPLLLELFPRARFVLLKREAAGNPFTSAGETESRWSGGPSARSRHGAKSGGNR